MRTYPGNLPPRTRFDQASATVLYVGEAVSGTGDDDNGWQIKRITSDVNGNPVEIAYANSGQPCVWAERATLEYK